MPRHCKSRRIVAKTRCVAISHPTLLSLLQGCSSNMLGNIRSIIQLIDKFLLAENQQKWARQA